MCYVNPRPVDDEIVDIYSTDYGGTREKIFSSDELMRRDRFMELIARWIDDRIDISSSPGKVLDIGCSEGSLLVALQKRAWDVWGVEPTPHFAEVARQRCGEHIKTGYLEQAGLPYGYFDMITIAQTLEHMPDPMSTLQIIRKLLKDDGVLYIDVPNVLKPKHAKCFAFL